MALEGLYLDTRRRGGPRAQLAAEISAEALAHAFASTVDELSEANGAGPFFSPGKRKSLFALGKEHAGAGEVSTTGHVCALLGRPPRWQVAGDPSLDFEFVARELTPMSSLKGGRRVWLRKSPERRLSLDALLVNADDRTPIVAEIKVKGDENAELALIQALACNRDAISRSRRGERKLVHRAARPRQASDSGPVSPEAKRTIL